MPNPQRRLPTLDEIQTEKAGRHLADYIRPAWPVIEPGTEYLHNWHIDAISEYLEAVTMSQIRRLIINLPPRNMKSIMASVDWPTWSWIKRPELRWLFASYSQSLSTKHSVDRRTIIQSAWYRQRWGDRYQLRGDANLKTEYMNDHRGHMIATSVGGTATGKGGDILVADDPLNPKAAVSDLQREGANTWFDGTFYTRLDDKRRGAIVLVMQRLHESDTTGHLLAKEAGWEHLCLPAEAEKRTIVVMPISGREIIREPGDILWPEREGPKELADAQTALGAQGYAGQYQQRPSPPGGSILKRHMWRYWRPRGVELPPVPVVMPDGEIRMVEAVELPERFDEMAQSWDMNFKDEESARGSKPPDFVVGQVWGRKAADKFLLHQARGRYSFPETIAAVERMSVSWPEARAKWIEDKANGSAVISMLRHKVAGLIPIQPDGGKIPRTQAASPEIESGNVYLPHPALFIWVEGFIEECAGFPNGANDDQADAATQALNKMSQGSIGPIPAATTATMDQLAGRSPAVPASLARSILPPALRRRPS
jgi:predicted phage terminase large subunit-like protein